MKYNTKYIFKLAAIPLASLLYVFTTQVYAETLETCSGKTVTQCLQSTPHLMDVYQWEDGAGSYVAATDGDKFYYATGSLDIYGEFAEPIGPISEIPVKNLYVESGDAHEMGHHLYPSGYHGSIIDFRLDDDAGLYGTGTHITFQWSVLSWGTKKFSLCIDAICSHKTRSIYGY